MSRPYYDPCRDIWRARETNLNASSQPATDNTSQPATQSTELSGEGSASESVSDMTVPPPPPPPPPPPSAAPRRPPTSKVSDVIHRLQPAKLFKYQDPPTSITSLDYDDQGELLVAAFDDDTLHLYDCQNGTHQKALLSKKYGAHLARFTHHSQSIIYASTKVDDTIRYLSTHDNQYIRYFAGHTGTVTCLTMNPGNDTFLSCSLDNTTRLWALNTPNPTGKLSLHGAYLAAFDPSASVAAIASPSTHSILLYDIRNFDKAPFATFDTMKIEAAYNPEAVLRPTYNGNNQPSFENDMNRMNNPGRWTTLEFSNDGKSILLGTASGLGHYVIDAFQGNLTAFCSLSHRPFLSSPATSSTPSTPSATNRLPPGIRPATKSPGVPSQGSVCLTPDGRYVIGGTNGDNLYVWDIHQAPPAQEDNAPEVDLMSERAKYILPPLYEPECPSKAEVIAFNPRMHMCATADKEVVLWLT